MKKEFNYTQEEEEIIDYIENWNPQSIPNLKEEIARYQEIAKNQFKEKSVNIRLPEHDIQKLKEKSKKKWVSYQTLIVSAVHEYANS
jgi:predicted DNA binding CopG/RHH family protein